MQILEAQTKIVQTLIRQTFGNCKSPMYQPMPDSDKYVAILPTETDGTFFVMEPDRPGDKFTYLWTEPSAALAERNVSSQNLYFLIRVAATMRGVK